MAVVVGAGQTLGRNDRQWQSHGRPFRPRRRHGALRRPPAGFGGRDGGGNRRPRAARPSAYEADITDEAACQALAAEAKARLGRIDILHNNVGVGLRDRGITTLEAADFDRIIDVNLKGMWLTIKHMLPVMREQGGGAAITNISSMAAVASCPTWWPTACPRPG